MTAEQIPISDSERVALGMMDSEQAETSEIRERFFQQPKESLKLHEPELTPDGKRLPPTPEQIAEMDR